MKTRYLRNLLAITAGIASAPAATVIADYDNSTGPEDVAFPYLAKVTLSTTDSWSDTINAGGWGYRNTNASANPNRGWGHSARWYLIELTAASSVTISLAGTDTSAWAGFVIYSGESVNDVPGSIHNFSNNGLDIAGLNGGWDKNGPSGTPGLGYVGHAHEAVQSPSATGTWNLGPGLYTIAFGNAADSSTSPTAKDFLIQIATVPEPSVPLLSLLAATALAGRRRRA